MSKLKEDKCDVCGEIIEPSFEVFRYQDYAFCSQECSEQFAENREEHKDYDK